jgi:hypothetical protein
MLVYWPATEGDLVMTKFDPAEWLRNAALDLRGKQTSFRVASQQLNERLEALGRIHGFTVTKSLEVSTSFAEAKGAICWKGQNEEFVYAKL